MKKNLLFLVVFAWLFSPAAWAYVFYTGGIYYNILSSDNKTVEVTRSLDLRYSGDVTIPATVMNEGIEYRVIAIGYCAFYDCTRLTSVTIPEGVTSIGEDAFSGCSGLTSVTIPNSVTTIGYDAFVGCTNLTSVTIPERVTSIGSFAFFGCDGLTSITIPNSVTTIGERTFSGCTGLTSVMIPESVTTIDYDAFGGCSGLKEVWFNADSCTDTWGYYNIVFSGCTSLKSVHIGENVKYISNKIFYRCTGLERFEGKWASKDHRCLVVNDTLKAFASSGLTKYTIPNHVKIIGNDAFSSCDSLTSITIPNSVAAIGYEAFSDCTGLKSVTAYNPEPVDIGYVFDGVDGVDRANCTLYVPAESVELYKAAAGWSEFGEILPIDESSAITETQQEQAAERITVYNLQGVLVLETDDAADLKTLQSGAYIVNGKTMIIAR